jgi:transcriptional regulator with XRE-family HTH domain
MSVNKAQAAKEEHKIARQWTYDLGARLMQRMAELNLSAVEVARLSRISSQQYNNYVKGNRAPNAKILQKISIVLETTIDELLDGDSVWRRDRESFIAGQRINETCRDLTSSDVRAIATFAELIRADRDHERRTFTDLSQGLQVLADVYERLLPSIVRNLKPILFGTAIDDRDGVLWLHIYGKFPPRFGAVELKNVYFALAKERLRVSPSSLTFEIGKDEVPTTFTIRLGASRVRAT